MYLSDAIKVLVRRWRILLAGGLVLLLLAVGVVSWVPTSYQASGRLLLLPPAQQVTEDGRSNPYLELPIGFTASLVADSMMTTDVHSEMVAAGFGSDYAASVAESTGFVGPLIEITVRGTDSRDAIATRNELLRRMREELVLIQSREDVASGQQISAREFGVSRAAEAIAGSKPRALAVVLTVGGSAVLFLAFGIDRDARKRAMRRRPATVAAPRDDATIQDLRPAQRGGGPRYAEAPTPPQAYEEYNSDGDARTALVSRHTEPGLGSASPTSIR